VGKSALARLVAFEYARRRKRVLLADLDALQATSLEWAERRRAAGLLPAVPAQRFNTAKEAIKAADKDKLDLLVVDGPGFADRQTMEAALASKAVLLPTGLGVDDLRPSVRLAHELVAGGCERKRLIFCLLRTGTGQREIDEARHYLSAANYRVVGETWPEKTGYRQAHDDGRAASEAFHPASRARAKAFIDAVGKILDGLLWGRG
jgi:chromosome partitioning protein